jgi:hypothetical protein
LAAPTTRVAAPGWTTSGLDEKLVVVLSEHFAQELRAQGLKVVTSTEIASLLGQERQKQLLGCAADSGSSCLAELGSALGCDGTLMVSAAKIDDLVQIDVKVLASSDARALAQASRRVSGSKQLLEGLDDLARVIAEALAEPTPAHRRWALSVGLIGGAATLTGAGLLVGARVTYDTLKRTLAANMAVLPGDELTAARGTAYWTAGWVGIGLGAAALVTAGLLYFLGVDSTVQPAVSLGPTGVSFGLSGRLP